MSEEECPCSEEEDCERCQDLPEGFFDKGDVLNTPRIVDSSELGWVEKLRARLGFYKRFGNLYLGYCGTHKIYFLDLEHTNGGIKCPTCDKAWLELYFTRQKR